MCAAEAWQDNNTRERIEWDNIIRERSEPDLLQHDPRVQVHVTVSCSNCQGFLDLLFGDKLLHLYDRSLFQLDWVVSSTAMPLLVSLLCTHLLCSINFVLRVHPVSPMKREPHSQGKQIYHPIIDWIGLACVQLRLSVFKAATTTKI